MKRLLCYALALALLCAASLPAALAEEVNEVIEAEVAEALVVDSSTGLVVEGTEEETPAPTEGSDPVQGIETTVPEIETTVSENDPVESIDPAQEGIEYPTDEGEQAVAAPEDIGPATGITLSAEVITIGVKEGYTGLTVVAEPEGAILPPIAWRVDNPKIARVDASGKITGVKKGTTTVYARMSEDSPEVACTVRVLPAPKKLNMKPTKLSLGADGVTYQLRFTVPSGYASNTFRWYTSNSKVAVVDQNGLVTTVGKGTATITVKAHNGKSGKCKLTVKAAPTGIAFSLPELSLAQGAGYKPSLSVSYGKGKKANPGITFSLSPDSQDIDCLELNPVTGQMTGVHIGSAIVVATTYNGKTAALPVTVAPAPTGITLNLSSRSIGVKEGFTGLTPTLGIPEGENGCASTLFWTSSNSKIAKVSADGKVTGVKKGSCTITVATTNGFRASCRITVYKQPKKVSISPAKGRLHVGDVNKYKVSFPKGYGGSVRFTSSDPSIATVAEDGTVTAISAGTVTVTVTAYNGKNAKAKLDVYGTDTSVQVPINEYKSVTSTTNQYSAAMSNSEKLEYVIFLAQLQLGKPYVYGGGYNKTNPTCFDCSGLVYWCFKQIGITMQDSAYKQGYKDTDKSGKISIRKVGLSELKRGDVVCFNTNDSDGDLSDHVGIYLGNGQFIHASSSGGKVITSTLASGYYRRSFSWGRRVLG